jgi:CTP synthase
MTAQFARETKMPLLGLCMGMQIATIEFARNVANLHKANSTEFDPSTPHPVICLLADQENISTKGATMRLGSWEARIKADTLAHRLYAKDVVHERHRHRWEFNQDYRETLENAGLVISATSPDETLAEIVELRDHPFYIAGQFHPEFQSKPNRPHPLFAGFVEAALDHHLEAKKSELPL